MAKKFAKFQGIDHNREITGEADHEFLNQLRKALLLALKEQGRLDTAQYRHAEERLRRKNMSGSDK